MLQLLCILVLLPLALQAEQSRFGEWKIDKTPALTPDAPPAWDDFAIGSASIIRLPDKWMMLYEGVALNEDGKSHAFGLAESADGIKWKKRAENPIFSPARYEWEIARVSDVAKWQDGWVALYIVNRGVTFEEKSPEDFNLPRESIWLAHSRDGLNWEPGGEIKALPFKHTRQAASLPCIYSDAGALHLWWISESEQGPALFHSTSRDAETWSKPNHQLTKEIDAREMAGARVRLSGDYYILTYVAFDEKNGPRLVTKVSQNTRTWTGVGPPEFSLPAHFALGGQWQQPVPSIVFTKEGARLFYLDTLFSKNAERPHPRRDAVRGALLRTAFSQKQDGQK